MFKCILQSQAIPKSDQYQNLCLILLISDIFPSIFYLVIIISLATAYD